MRVLTTGAKTGIAASADYVLPDIEEATDSVRVVIDAAVTTAFGTSCVAQLEWSLDDGVSWIVDPSVATMDINATAVVTGTFLRFSNKMRLSIDGVGTPGDIDITYAVLG